MKSNKIYKIGLDFVVNSKVEFRLPTNSSARSVAQISVDAENFQCISGLKIQAMIG